ncbi:DUF2267 domain-containing protein [Fulvivirga ulvae]|uniref:DUF2267 domain-containing protein n=1 Tax=Fulvivirga ulvae TaxID=2904245 RepID=UPI001F4539A2|nr:DUF2267 domain-containing protein [Fulvivirga ulvae]UII31389.1 DUF2267 domain-containing protein [Fulvivirga ulvae]
MEIDYNKLVKNDCGCLEEIKEALGIPCNFKAGKVIGRVLHTLRSSLTYSESADLIQLLPDPVKIIYVSDWRLKTPRIELRHLDDFVREVMRNDKMHAEQVLSNEVTALKAVITTVRIINKYIGILSYNFFKYPLKQELEEAMFEAA